MAMFNSKLLTSPEGMIYDNPLAFGASDFQRLRKFTSNLALVGGFNHLEKYWSMGRIIPYIMENKKCLKPPTSSIFYLEDHNHPVSHEKITLSHAILVAQ